MKKLRISKVLMSFLILFSSITTSLCLPEPYNSIELLPFDPHGWCSRENRNNLQRIIAIKKPKIVIEIGSWLGKSAIFMAEQLVEYVDNPILYAIDPWKGSIEHLNPRLGVIDKLPTLYQQFLSNVIHKNMTHVIIPVRKASMEAMKVLDVIPNLVYVDGSHAEEDAYDDIMHWYKKLSIGGTMCGDDWKWLSVRRAVERASQELGREISVDENFWYFDEKSE